MKHLRFVLLMLCGLVAAPLSAQEITPDVPLQDMKLETQARALFRELRCEVCDGQSIGDSNAALASDMRALVRQRLVAGETPEAILHFLADRYGEAILMRPPLAARTWLLWFAPILGILLGGFFFSRYFRNAALEGK